MVESFKIIFLNIVEFCYKIGKRGLFDFFSKGLIISMLPIINPLKSCWNKEYVPGNVVYGSASRINNGLLLDIINNLYKSKEGFNFDRTEFYNILKTGLIDHPLRLSFNKDGSITIFIFTSSFSNEKYFYYIDPLTKQQKVYSANVLLDNRTIDNNIYPSGSQYVVNTAIVCPPNVLIDFKPFKDAKSDFCMNNIESSFQAQFHNSNDFNILVLPPVSSFNDSNYVQSVINDYQTKTELEIRNEIGEQMLQLRSERVPSNNNILVGKNEDFAVNNIVSNFEIEEKLKGVEGSLLGYINNKDENNK